jgi:signal transduction histidine kinase
MLETILTEGFPRVLSSSTDTERLVRRIFRDVAGLLTIGPISAVYAGPWIRRWLGMTSKPGLIPSRRDLRDTLLVVVLFSLAFWMASAVKTAWQVELYYVCLLPLLYFAAQRGTAVTTLSVFGCTIAATLLWNHYGLSSALQLSDLRTLLAAYAMTALVIAGQAGERLHSFRLQGDLVRQLRRLTAHLESVREEEQIRIAREVHDELGGLLTALKLDLGMLRRQLSPMAGEAAIVECQRLSSSVDKIISAVQRIATELRPGVLDNLGLAAAVQWVAQDFERRTGARCIASPVEEVPAGKDMATALYKILQEALTNVTRHAGATEVWISLTHSGSSIELRVEDNGKGIAEEHLIATDSLGLTGMRERAAALGGELEIDRLVRGGTAVRARIPITARRVVGVSK